MTVVLQRDVDAAVACQNANIIADIHKLYRPANDNALSPLSTPVMDPFDFDAAGGLIGECAQWIFDTSRTPIQEFCTLASIAAMSAMFGRRCVGPTGAGLNLYAVMAAPTGFGKNRPLTAPGIIVQSLGAAGARLIGPSNVTGDSAIERALRRSPCLLMPMDEFGLLLQGATSKTAPPWTQTIRRALLELFSRSEPCATWKAKLMANPKAATEPIQQPTLTVLGATTPEEFYAGLTTSSTSNGFLNRLVVVAVTQRPADQDVAALPKFPNELAAKLKAALEAFPAVNGDLSRLAVHDATSPAAFVAVEYADEAAKERFALVQADQRRMLDSETELAGLAERVGENTIKLATIRAISRCPAAPKVDTSDIEWGWAIVHRSIETVAHGVARYMAGSVAEALRKQVESHIINAGVRGLPKSKLMEKRGMTAAGHELEGALEWLCKTGQIAVYGKLDQKGRRGRSGERYVARQSLPTAEG